MNKIPIFFFFVWLILLHGGCTTMEERAASIRSQERVLFECRVRHGRLLTSERQIDWEPDGEVPLIVTPTTLFFGVRSLPISQIESIEVGDFDHDEEIFVKAHTIEDLVLIKPDLKDYYPGLAFRISGGGEGSPDSVRAQAEQLKSILEAARRELDPFGRARQPRPVWIGFIAGEVRAIWNVEPRYLQTRFPGEDERVTDVFRMAGASNREVQESSMKRLLCETVEASQNAYQFIDAGTLSLRGPRMPGPVRKRLRDRDPFPDSIVLVDVPFIFLQEKMDPYGNVSIHLRIRTVIRMMDLEKRVIGSEVVDFFEVAVPIADLLGEGSTGINGIMAQAANQAADRVKRKVNGL